MGAFSTEVEIRAGKRPILFAKLEKLGYSVVELTLDYEYNDNVLISWD